MRRSGLWQLPAVSFIVLLTAVSDLSTHPSAQRAVRLSILRFASVPFRLIRVVPGYLYFALVLQKAVAQSKHLNLSLYYGRSERKDD